MFVVPLTRPADAGHPLPSGEGFSKKNISHLGQQCVAPRAECWNKNT
jgi:hypothetical protein